MLPSDLAREARAEEHTRLHKTKVYEKGTRSVVRDGQPAENTPPGRHQQGQQLGADHTIATCGWRIDGKGTWDHHR